MGIAQQQAALARLYTDAALRERFFADPIASAAILQLSSDEAQQMAQMSAAQVAIFADSLHNKRIGEARKLLSGTSRALGEQFSRLFRRHAAQTMLPETQKYLNDAIAFVAFLTAQSGNEKIESWIIDIARYEAAWLEATHSSSRLVVRCFAHRVGPLRYNERNQQVIPLSRGITFAFWFRLPFNKRLRYFEVPWSRAKVE